MKNVKDLTDVVSAPLGDLIAEVGKGVADAQYAMDKQTLALLEDIYAKDETYAELLRSMGYRPNWYQIPEAEAEIQLALSVTGSFSNNDQRQGRSAKNQLQMYAAPMNATYSNSFDYEMTASSTLKMKIVPVPEPAPLENRQVVPLLNGKTLGQAKDILSSLDIAYETDANDDALPLLNYAPSAGEILALNQIVSLVTQA